VKAFLNMLIYFEKMPSFGFSNTKLRIKESNETGAECVSIKNKRPMAMGHIAHLRNLGPYRNIFPISNMHLISICPI
jgi:hypothetical protein